MSEGDAQGLVSIDLQDVVIALRRRLGWLSAGLVSGLLLGFLVYRSMPPVFLSEATLLVESRWFPESFFQDPHGKSSMRDRLQTLKYRITSDRAMAEIADEVGPERFDNLPTSTARNALIRGAFQFDVEDATSPDAAVVRLGYKSGDPALAKDVVASMIRYAVEDRRQEGEHQATATSDVLRTELDELRRGLTEKSDQLSRLATRLPASGSGGSETDRSAHLNALGALQNLEVEAARAETIYKPQHPNLLKLQDELRRARARLRHTPLGSGRETQGDDPNPQYQALLQEYESDLQTYEGLLARRIDATMAERLHRAGVMPEIQLLQEPQLPKTPIAPKPLLFLAGGAGAGLGLAAMIALLPLLLRRTFASAERLMQASGMPVLAVIPELPAGDGTGPDPRLAVLTQPGSAAAEQYRQALPYLLRAQGTPVALVTSADRGAGKSVCALNIAASVASNGQRRTLLIDADLRQPSLHRLLGVPEGPGLAESVRGDVSLATAAISTSVPGLFLLQAGDARQNPVAILEDERLMKLIDAARREFGAVLIDAPPRITVVDAALLERLATLVLFVVRAEQTPRASVLRGLRGISLPVGLILNGVKRDVYRSQFGSDPSEPPYPDRRQ